MIMQKIKFNDLINTIKIAAAGKSAIAGFNRMSARRRQLCRCGFHCYKWDWRRLGKYCQYCGRKKRKNHLTD